MRLIGDLLTIPSTQVSQAERQISSSVAFPILSTTNSKFSSCRTESQRKSQNPSFMACVKVCLRGRSIFSGVRGYMYALRILVCTHIFLPLAIATLYVACFSRLGVIVGGRAEGDKETPSWWKTWVLWSISYRDCL
jgi:hypothetical protein